MCKVALHNVKEVSLKNHAMLFCRTLVSTNERLLKELDEARSRHKTEVEQLHWNYDQLKKTTDAVPPTNVKNNSNNRC